MSKVSGYIDSTGEFVAAAPHSYPATPEGTMQVLTAHRIGDTRGWPTFRVESDELGTVGEFTGGAGSDADAAIDAITEAWEELA